MFRTLAIVATVLLLAAVLGPGLAGADGAWLDGPVTNWNRPGMAIPKAPPRNSASQPQCFDSALKPDSPPQAGGGRCAAGPCSRPKTPPMYPSRS